MGKRYYSSTASSKTLSSAVTTTDTTISLNNLTGLPASYPYTLVLDPDTASEEIVLVTGLASGTTLNVTRGSDTYSDSVVGNYAGGNGTAKQTHTSGAVVKHMITARDLQEPQDHIHASTNVHGLTSGAAVVGTTSSQTLTNKTISGSNNTISISSSNISDWSTQFNLKANIASPTFTGTVVLPSTTSIGSVSDTELGYLNGVTSDIQTQLNAKAPTASPTFTGTVSMSGASSVALPSNTTGTTQAAGTNSTRIATTAFVKTAVDTAVPSQTGNSGKYLTTDGTNTSWATLPTGTGGVTSITAGTGLTGGTITSTGTIAIDTATVTTLTGSQTLTNKTLSDSSTFFVDNVDPTKKMQFQISSVTAGQTRTLTVPDASGTVALAPSTNGVAAWTGSAFTSRTITASSGGGLSVSNGDGVSGNPTLSVDTAIVATLTGSQTLSNKTLDSGTIATTQALGDNTTKIATTAFVQAAALPLWYRRTTDTATISSTATTMFATSPSLDSASWYYFEIYAYVPFSYTGSSASISMTLSFSNAPQSVRATVATTGANYASQITSTSATAVTGTMTGSVNNVILLQGFINTHATLGSTLNPQISVSNGSITVNTGSHVKIQKLSSSAAAINGTWT